MTDKSQPDNQEIEFFIQQMAGVKRLKQDKVEPVLLKKKKQPKKQIEKKQCKPPTFIFRTVLCPTLTPINLCNMCSIIIRVI